MLKSQFGYWFGKELKSFEFEKLTISNTALGFTAATLIETNKENAVRAVVTVESKSIRYRTDGSDPTTTTGHLVYTGGMIVIEGKTNLERFRAIRVTDDATIQVTYQRYE